jgi:ubiquinone/menaquinone biosynthesis C-methylase UbiE
MELICPECKLRLSKAKEDNSYSCERCKLSYPIISGIPSFLREIDSFYEGKFTVVKKNYGFSPSALLFYIYHSISIASSRERFLRKSFKKILPKFNQSTVIHILDLGCGGGWEELTKYGKVTGMDISFKSLTQARMIYDAVIHADASKMPFPDGYFDVVFSTDVLGHIPSNIKDRVLSEIFRVTKKGGFSIHSFECDSESLFYKWAKKYPELYRKYFVEMYGHFGLEPYRNAFARFRAVGFTPVLEAADITKGYLREISSYPIFFDNEFKAHAKTIKALVAICNLLSSQKIIRIITDFLLGFLVPFASLVTPDNHRDSLKIIYKKLE